jgi:hypothetical protein
MKIWYGSGLLAELQDKYLFLDTTALIVAISFEKEFSKLFEEIKLVKCEFLTIPSVVFEFTRGSTSLKQFNERVEFIDKTLGVSVYPIEKHLDKLEDLIVILQRISGGISYTDFLLCACLYKFKKSYLLTENHKDFPTEVLDRKSIITIDTGGRQVRNTAIYQFSKRKFDKVAESILKRKKIIDNDIPF